MNFFQLETSDPRTFVHLNGSNRGKRKKTMKIHGRKRMKIMKMRKTVKTRTIMETRNYIAKLDPYRANGI
jgi:hypothetical protein